jgi:uncharacterized protein (TIGR03437 family)
MARYYKVLPATSIQSAASGSGRLAPSSIASIFGSNLADGIAQAGSTPLPSMLGGVNVKLHDATGVDRDADLSYVSPGQINFIVPAGVAPGIATVTIVNGNAKQTATAVIQNVAPALFSMNGNGTGVAAATAVRTQAGSGQLQSPVPVFQCSASGCVSLPINLGVDTPVYVTLYGTGIRNRSSLSAVSVTINGIAVPVLYAGAQALFPGLDQVNIQLPLSLRGAREASVVVTVDGWVSNAVTLNIL